MTKVFLAGVFLGGVAEIYFMTLTFADTKRSRNLDVTKFLTALVFSRKDSGRPFEFVEYDLRDSFLIYFLFS